MKIKNKQFITSMIGCMFSVACWAVQANSDKVRYHPKYPNIPIPAKVSAKGKIVVDAPIGDYNRSPILTTYINGKGPYFFLFDTGWGGAMLSKKVAHELNLPLVDGKQAKQVTPNQVIDVYEYLYRIDKLDIGDITLHDYVVTVNSNFEDDIQLFSRRGAVGEAGIDGVIGLNAFYGLMVHIDYKNEQLTFEKNSLSLEDKAVLPYERSLEVPNVSLKLHFHRLHKHTMQTFIVDTGFDQYIRINSCLIPEMHDFIGKHGLSAYDYRGHESKSYYAQLYGKIELRPDYSIESPFITFASNNCQNKPLGLLGQVFFDQHLVIIDHDDRLVKIIRNE